MPRIQRAARALVLAVALILVQAACAGAAELSVPPLVELDAGASKGIAYTISRETADPSRIILHLFNRGKRDIRLTYSIIPGAGDPLGDQQRTCIIKAESAWPMRGQGRVACALRKPGVRIDEIETGVIEEEEGYYYDADGNETRSNIFRFKPDVPVK